MAKKKSKRRAKCTVRVGKSRLKYTSFIKRKCKAGKSLKGARAAWKKATKKCHKATTKRKARKSRKSGRKHRSKR